MTIPHDNLERLLYTIASLYEEFVCTNWPVTALSAFIHRARNNVLIAMPSDQEP